MSMIGEIRHRATTQHALHCAESGHLCVSTLHASNASQAVQRVLNFFSAPAQRQLLVGLSLSLQAVAAQRLVKSVQGSVVPAMEVMLLTPYVSELIQKSHADNRTDVTLRLRLRLASGTPLEMDGMRMSEQKIEDAPQRTRGPL